MHYTFIKMALLGLLLFSNPIGAQNDPAQPTNTSSDNQNTNRSGGQNSPPPAEPIRSERISNQNNKAPKSEPIKIEFDDMPGDGKTIYDPERAKNISTEEVVVTDRLKLKRRLKDIYANISLEYWLGRQKKNGMLRIKLYHLQAPQTVENFVKLAEGLVEFKLPGQEKGEKKPFYNGLTFHRIIRKFVAQSGDPLGNNKGAGPGYTIPLEFNGRLVHDRMGVVSMVRSGKESHGSQFFITLAPIPNLDGVNSIFGQVVDGAEVLNDFDKIKTNREDVPKRPITIKEITINRVYL